VKSYDVVTFCVRRTGGVAKTDHGSAEKNRALRQWRSACKFQSKYAKTAPLVIMLSHLRRGKRHSETGS